MSSLKQLLCAVRGHEEYLHFESDRVYLQCVGCGHESPGWTTGRRKYSAAPQARRAEKSFSASSGQTGAVRPLIRKVA